MKKVSFVLFIFLIVTVSSAFGRSPKNRWAKYDGGKVHYYDIGKNNKKALIFIHGWTCNADFWKDSFDAFSEYRIIAIDLPGHGQSDKPHANYTMEYFARSIDAVMKDAKIDKAVLVGHSMGTPVIRQFYRLYPKKTLGLVVVDGALKPFGPKEQMDKFFEPLLSDYRSNAAKFIDGLLGPTREDLKPSIRATMLSAPDYVAVSAMKGMLDESIWTNDQIKVPTLAVMAETPWPKDNAEIYQTIAPNIDYQRWNGVSHFLMMEKPREFSDIVRSFVIKNKLL